MTEGLERLPPHSREAEMAVLGACMRHNQAIAEVASISKADDFYTDAHQKIFSVMVKLWEAGKAVDLVTVAEGLKEVGQIEDVGGYGYIAEIWDATVTGANAEHYARIVHDKAVLRGVIRAGTEMLRSAYEQSAPLEEILASAEKQVFALTSDTIQSNEVPLHIALSQVSDQIDAIHAGNVQSGVPTGFTDLDEKIGGLRAGELIIIGARPSHGKTAFAVNVARSIGMRGYKSLFISLEQSRDEIALRMLSVESRVSMFKMRSGKLRSEDFEKMNVAMGELRGHQVWIESSSWITFLRIAGMTRRAKIRRGLDVVFIDYLQLIEPDGSRSRDSRQEHVAGTSRRLKQLARELNVPVVVLAQVNRGAEERTDHTPRLSDLRESGAIEQDADLVLLLHRPEMYEAGKYEGVCEVHVAKQRNGYIGQIELVYMKECFRFENSAAESHFMNYDPKPERQRAP